MFREAVEVTTLSNGLRVVSEYLPTVRSVAVGAFVRVGARYEPRSAVGITHFLEHMLFKGTQRRTARDLAAAIESRGGMLNAYTEKEYTCYFARGLDEDAGLIVDVLADMLRNAALDPAEIEREKDVVLQEIKRSHDDPEHAVHDLLDRTLWRRHPIGRSTLGTARSVKGFSREQLVAFLRQRYEPGSIVLAAAGHVRHRHLVSVAKRLFGDMEPRPWYRRAALPASHGATVFRRRPTEQVVFGIGVPTYAYGDSRVYTVAILDIVLGSTMSSRLFQEIREKRGLAYDIGTHSQSFADTGVFVISGGTSAERFDLVLDLVRSELRKIQEDGVTRDELDQAKRRLRGQLVLGLENPTARALGLGRSLLLLDRVVPLDEVLGEVEVVTTDTVRTVARELFADERQVVVALGPFARNGGGQ